MNRNTIEARRRSRVVAVRLVAALAMVSVVHVTASLSAAGAASEGRAAELLTRARAALGSEERLANIQGLSCAGTLQRLAGDRLVSGDIAIDVQLPDKMLRSDRISPMGDAALVVTDQGINGDILLRRTSTMNAPPGMVLRVPPPPSPGGDAEAQALRNSRAELARFALAMVLTTKSAMPLELEYGGVAAAPDGTADVIRVTGPSNFAAQLFLDRETHRPLMLVYRGVVPQMRVQTRSAASPPGPGDPGDANAALSAQMVDITMYLDDYRRVGGVLLPHHVSKSVDGQTNEEWMFKTIKVNPVFKPDTFAAR